MAEPKLVLVGGNKSRVGNLQWGEDDYDVREGTAGRTHLQAIRGASGQIVVLGGADIPGRKR